MNQASYPFQRSANMRYIFTSTGKKKIKKLVEFNPTVIPKIVNMGFGDLLDDGQVDDTARSNNGDIAKVLSTVIMILRDYLAQIPAKKFSSEGAQPIEKRPASFRKTI